MEIRNYEILGMILSYAQRFQMFLSFGVVCGATAWIKIELSIEIWKLIVVIEQQMQKNH